MIIFERQSDLLAITAIGNIEPTVGRYPAHVVASLLNGFIDWVYAGNARRHGRRSVTLTGGALDRNRLCCGLGRDRLRRR